MTDDQIRPQGIHHARGFGERMCRCDGKPELGEDRLAAITVVRILVYEQNQRRKTLLVAQTTAAARPCAAIGAVPLVWYA